MYMNMNAKRDVDPDVEDYEQDIRWGEAPEETYPAPASIEHPLHTTSQYAGYSHLASNTHAQPSEWDMIDCCNDENLRALSDNVGIDILPFHTYKLL